VELLVGEEGRRVTAPATAATLEQPQSGAFGRCQGVEAPGEEVIVGAGVGRDATDECRQGGGQIDAFGGSPEGLDEELRIGRASRQPLERMVQGDVHLQLVLDREQDLGLEGRRAAVPHEAAPEGAIDEGRRVAQRPPAVHSDGQGGRVREAPGGLVTGRAGDSLVAGEQGVEEEPATQSDHRLILGGECLRQLVGQAEERFGGKVRGKLVDRNRRGTLERPAGRGGAHRCRDERRDGQSGEEGEASHAAAA
jgi:hypothetical protein